MKKNIFVYTLICLALFASCKPSASKKQNLEDARSEEKRLMNKYDFDGDYANDEAVRKAFTLDYSPMLPEPDSLTDTLSADELSHGVSGGFSKDQVIPGLRKLADYKMPYIDGNAKKERMAEIAELQKKAGMGALAATGSKEALTVTDWGLSSTLQRPSIYIVFSQPMVEIASLAEQKDSSPFVTITPSIKGSFRWYGTSFLSFEASEATMSQQTYTITVKNDAKSIFGNMLQRNNVFTFETERLSMRSIEAGIDFRKKNPGLEFSDTDVPPAAAKQITITFNYPVKAQDIKNSLEISTSKESAYKIWGQAKNSTTALQFALSQIDEYKVQAAISDNIDYGNRIYVTLKKGAKSGYGNLGTSSDQDEYISTPGSFVVKKAEQETSWGEYKTIVRVDFSYAVDEASLQGAFSTEPKMEIKKDNIKRNWDGKSVRIVNLPIKYDDKFTLKIAQVIHDVYGRTLEVPHSSEIKMPSEPPPVGEVRFLDYGDVMLEAQFAPRLLFEYKNIVPQSEAKSWYTLESRNNIFAKKAEKSSGKIILLDPVTNYRYFEEMDLKPYLNAEGKGIVFFNAELTLLNRITSWDKDKTFTRKNNLTIQVTDLGATVRHAFNKTVVLVTGLKTGLPIAGATVRLITAGVKITSSIENIDRADYFASAYTDANGMAILETGAGVLRENIKKSYNEEFYVYVEKGGDRIIFNPSSHSTWPFNIYASPPLKAEEVSPVTFMFSDRGIYKNGETLSFRGVDKTLVLGNYAAYCGDYEITLEEYGFEGKVIHTLNGTTSDSGGFYGTVEIPLDLKPANYALKYKRVTEGKKENASVIIPVQVAYFERLKFQASIAKPAAAVINGDDINMTLNASYLAGGSLAGASYSSAWYKQLSRFRSNVLEFKDYTFGPQNVYDGRYYSGDSNGVLGATGSAVVSTQTKTDRGVEGAAYVYTNETTVTDLSNQIVSAFATVQVHPALFYIGLDNSSQNGFAKSGEEQTHRYVTVNVDGTALNDRERFANGSPLTVELIRKEWKRIQQQGVNGYIYDRYEEFDVIDSTQKLVLKNSGDIKIKPSSAGYYILRLTSSDRDGRKIITEKTFYATGSKWSYWNMNDASAITITPDAPEYTPGEKAQLLMQSPLPGGYYLITVEREGIFTQEIRHFEESTNIVEIPIARNFVPVIYVSIASYSVRRGEPTHTYGTQDLDKPKSYYGVTKLFVNKNVRAFSVKVESDKKVFNPGDEVTLTLTATKNGRPLENAELTLMGVDRGVLDLINYHVQNPIDYFYNEERFNLKVSGGDSRSMLMDPVTYSIKNLIGGDSDSKLNERKDFNPLAVFEPFLITDKNGKVSAKFKLPDTLTTYRITVFGVADDLFSLKESEIAAQNKINVQQVQVRRMRERDTSEAGVLITNLDKIEHKVNVSLNIGVTKKTANGDNDADDGLDGLIIQNGLAFIDGKSEHSLRLKSGENAVVYFDVAALKRGTVTLEYTIRSDIINEKLISPMIIEAPYTRETFTTTGALTSGSAKEAIIIPSFADDGVGEITLSLDATRLSLLESSVQYLFHYPYGCMEQRSAAILPLVIFGEYINVLGMKSEVDNPKKAVEKELREWAKVQRPDGGFPYWPNGLETDPYVTSRIAYIIALAKEKNIKIPSSLNVSALNKYVVNESGKNNYTYSPYYTYTPYTRAYMNYVKSLLGEDVSLAAVRDLAEKNSGDPCVLSFCGLTFAKLKKDADVKNIEVALKSLLRQTTRGVDVVSRDNDYSNYYYGSLNEQLALALEFFVGIKGNDELNTKLLYSLLQNKRANGYWDSTAITVRVLAAVDALIKADNLEKLNATAKMSLNGTQIASGNFKGILAQPVTEKLDFKTFPLAGMQRDSKLPLEINKSGAGNIYWSASISYAIPVELQDFRDEGIGLNMAITDLKSGAAIKDYALEAGRLYKASIKLTSNRQRTYLALRVPLPSGAVIMDAASSTRPVSNKFIYDNEVQYFWDAFAIGEITVELVFQAARRGVYPTPPLHSECMYESEIFGRTGGTLWTIR